MDKKKSQHYNFCYDVIPALFHSQSSDFVKYVEQDGLKFIEFWWNHVGQQLPHDKLVKFTNAQIEISEPKAGTKVIFLLLPPPQEIEEMYFMAMVANPERRFAWVRLPTTRVLGLAKQSKDKFPEGTDLGDLTPRRIFVSLGKGLSPTIGLFKQTVLELANLKPRTINSNGGMMKLDTGMIVVLVAIGIFYLRLIQLRGRRRKERREEQLERMKLQQKRKPNDAPLPRPPERPMFQIASWWLLGAGAALMLVGLGFRYSPGILPVVEPYWWIITSVGVLLFTFGLK